MRVSFINKLKLNISLLLELGLLADHLYLSTQIRGKASKTNQLPKFYPNLIDQTFAIKNIYFTILLIYGQIHKRQKSIKKFIIFQISILQYTYDLYIYHYNSTFHHIQDIYYRKAKEDQFRARSAYKLLQIDDSFQIFRQVERAIDLCAAPGSWSQVLVKKLTEKNYLPSESCRIVSVDLQEMAPLDHVTQIQGDITKKTTVDEILKKFNYQRADIIVCDGAPDVTGFHDIDYYIQSQLIVAALNICLMTLRDNGIFVAKIFKGSDIKLLYSQFKLFFNQVYFMKPKSSRASSVEYFIICLQYTPKVQTQNFHLYTFLKEIEEAEKQKQEEIIDKETEKEQSKYYKFITCGDLSGFDEN
ncbi:unnamed protein product [Paramecium octaurelia]|uniref:Ribosomal RNA methyltransferase FtsJ domain-containing protein n=1 Tax=Paramecium octaurelia TaxID=43137 RepID=A0A8S1XWS9_PAROT|nr:unnamed protein product [Paramecium octaurelia]